MTVHTQLQFDESSKALESTTSKYALALAREASVDTSHAEATAALTAAIDEKSLLSAKIVKGGSVTPAVAGAAASRISDAREHLSLIAGAKDIAAKESAAAEREFLDAQYSHEIHVIRAKRLALAGKQRAMQQKANDYAQSVEECRDAGEQLLFAQRDALARRKHAPVGYYGGEFDQSLTAVRFLVRSLPMWVLKVVRESPVDSVDYAAIADMTEREATL